MISFSCIREEFVSCIPVLFMWHIVIKSAKFTSCLFFVFQIKMPWCWRRTPHGPWSQSACRKGLLTHLPAILTGKLSSTKRPAVVQELQKNVEDVRMRLFHLFLQDFVNWPCHSLLFNHVPHQRVPRSMASVEQPERNTSNFEKNQENISENMTPCDFLMRPMWAFQTTSF